MQESCVKVALLQPVLPNRPHRTVLLRTMCDVATPTIRFRASELRGAFPHGVATARQLTAHGIPERTTYHRCLDGGPWTRLLPGVVLLSTGKPTTDQRVRAALLLAGDQAVVTGLEACRRHGLRRGPVGQRSERSDDVHLLVPHGRQVRSVGFAHIERTLRNIEPVIKAGVPLAPVVRACTDAARRLTAAGEIAELLSDAVQRRLCTVAELASDLDAGSRRGTAMPRLVLRELAEGVRSAAERDARRMWMASGLPDAEWNVPIHDASGLFLGVADCWLDDVAMVWEIESSEWHLGPEEHSRTVERAAEFVAAGIIYTASKPSQVHDDWPAVATRLRATYGHARARPRPPVVKG
jgi:hypothetical protein